METEGPDHWPITILHDNADHLVVWCGHCCDEIELPWASFHHVRLTAAHVRAAVTKHAPWCGH